MAEEGADAGTCAFGSPHPPAAGSQGLSGCGKQSRSRGARPGSTRFPVRNPIHFPLYGELARGNVCPGLTSFFLLEAALARDHV